MNSLLRILCCVALGVSVSVAETEISKNGPLKPVAIKNPATPPPQPPPPPKTELTKETMQLLARLAKGKATVEDTDACIELIDTLDDEIAKKTIAYHLIRHQRKKQKAPDRAVEFILPFILKPEVASKFKLDLFEAKRVATEGFSIELPKNTLLVEVPPLEDWHIDDENAPFAIEAARCLCMLEKPDLALPIIDMIGRQFENENRALAAECGGDIFVWMKMYDKAVEFYALGANVIRTLEKENFSATCSDADRRAIRSRIEYRLRFARMMLDEERFDPAWAAYRYTRTVHTVYNGYIDAFMLYARIMEEFPDTMYADAAENYMIEILLLLADRRNLPAMAERFEQKKSDLRAAQWELAMSKSSGELPAVQKWRQARVDELISQIQKWRTIPLGQMALQKAEEVTEKFVARDKFGLYRGEALLNVGLHHLTVGLDMDKAEEWLRRANGWFDEMRDMDKDLKDFTLPDSVRNLAMPPREERFKDQWENVRLSEPRPGDVFNRRTCKWYLNSKQKDCVLALGLIEFARGYANEAETQWNRLAELDKEFYAEQAASGWENATVHYRLMWNLKNNKTSLYATPEEMAAFIDPKRKLAVLIADLFYEAGRPDRAISIYAAFIDGKFGELSKNELAYATYGAFACFCWNSKVNEIGFIEPRLRLFEGTPTLPRLCLSYANRAIQMDDVDYLRKAIIMYKHHIK